MKLAVYTSEHPRPRFLLTPEHVIPCVGTVDRFGPFSLKGVIAIADDLVTALGHNALARGKGIEIIVDDPISARYINAMLNIAKEG